METEHTEPLIDDASGAATAGLEWQPLADGVYLGLPMERYVKDRALSGSAFTKLNHNAPDWWFEHESNPLYTPPESPARELGAAFHCALFEGDAAFDARYCTAPARELHPGAVDSADDLAAWIDARNTALESAPLAILEALGMAFKNGKFKPLPKSGTKEAVYARIVAHCTHANELRANAGVDIPQAVAPRLWSDIVEEHAKGREIISDDAATWIQLAAASVRDDPKLSRLLGDGVPEVSVFWTEDRVRYKARLDWIKPNAIVDGKSFGRISPRGLLHGILADRINHGDDMQAVQQTRAVERLAQFKPQQWHVAEGYERHAERLREIVTTCEAFRFVWLCVRIGGAPTTAAITFDNDGLVWGAAVAKIGHAVETFKKYRAEFGERRMWVRSLGLYAPDISEWPMHATAMPND